MVSIPSILILPTVYEQCRKKEKLKNKETLQSLKHWFLQKSMTSSSVSYWVPQQAWLFYNLAICREWHTLEIRENQKLFPSPNGHISTPMTIFSFTMKKPLSDWEFKDHNFSSKRFSCSFFYSQLSSPAHIAFSSTSEAKAEQSCEHNTTYHSLPPFCPRLQVPSYLFSD